MLTCVKCHKEIIKKDEYFRVTKFKSEKNISEFFVHKVCWDNIMNPRKLTLALAGKAMKMLNRVEAG